MSQTTESYVLRTPPKPSKPSTTLQSISEETPSPPSVSECSPAESAVRSAWESYRAIGKGLGLPDKSEPYTLSILAHRAKQGTLGRIDFSTHSWWQNRDHKSAKTRAIEEYIQTLHPYNTDQKHLRESRETPEARTDREFRELLYARHVESLAAERDRQVRELLDAEHEPSKSGRLRASMKRLAESIRGPGK